MLKLILAVTGAVLCASFSVLASGDMPSDSSPDQDSTEHWHRHLKHHGNAHERHAYLAENDYRLHILEQKIDVLMNREAHYKQVAIDYIERGGSPLEYHRLKHRHQRDMAELHALMHEYKERMAIKHGR